MSLAERGTFLALDLGGTNFRVLLIDLVDSENVLMKNKIYPIAHTTMNGPGEKVLMINFYLKKIEVRSASFFSCSTTSSAVSSVSCTRTT